jgi:quercetin dioxygenase-like cupin family protein
MEISGSDDRSVYHLTHRKAAEDDREPYKFMFKGEEGSPDYFHWFEATLEKGLYSPRHHHTFDQVHLLLDGEYRLRKDAKPLPPGSVTYIGEGVFYGPLEGNENWRFLSLQVTGAGGTPHLSFDQLNASSARLSERGSFANGVYTYTDEDGRQHNQDGYEAIWEEVNQRKIKYPVGRYTEPVQMVTDAFNWVPLPEQKGVSVRHLGTFNELQLRAQFFKLDKGATFKPAEWPSNILGYVTHGSVTEAEGSGGTVKEGMGLLIPPGDKVTLLAEEDTEIFTIWLPIRPGIKATPRPA